jgi:phosphate butyryltransferase
VSLADFAALLALARSGGDRRVIVVEAQDEHAPEAALRARDDGIAEPLLVGDSDRIRETAERLGLRVDAGSIVHVPEGRGSAEKGVELARSGAGHFIMKGKIQTADLLKAVVDKASGLRTGNQMSHIAIDEVPRYHKLLAITDGGMIMYPDLEQKRCILENAVGLFRRLGCERPKVAVLAAVENVNEKMPETVDAAALKRMNAEGIICDCVVEGPISYDLAMSVQSAAIKGYESPVSGDADILLVPNITVGNVLGKCLVCSAGARMAGIVVGAKVPVVITSRGSSADEKYLSLVLATAVSEGGPA